MHRVTKNEFHAAVGRRNVHPQVSESSLKDRVHVSHWQERGRVIGRTETDSWGVIDTEFFLSDAALLGTPIVIVAIVCDDDDPITCSLAKFLADNVDGINEEERAAIAETITRGDSYTGGGGATPEWTVRPLRR